MNKSKKSITVGILALLLATLFSPTVYAQDNQMQDLHIHVELHEDGSGTVTEYRQMEMHEGTELYMTMENMGQTEVTDFEVEGFTYNPDWDSDEGLEEKAGEYGVIELDSDTQELVWGISEYGQQDYTATYTLSNLVRELEDGQGLFWNFDTYSDIPPENFTMEVEHPAGTLNEQVDVWAFGFEGESWYEGDTVYYEANEPFTSSNHPTVLIQYPLDTFAVTATEDMTLAEQEEMATEGTGGYNPDSSSNASTVFGVIFGGAMLLLFGGIGYAFKHDSMKKAHGHLNINKFLREDKDAEYAFAPYTEGDMADIAWILHQLGTANGSFDFYFKAYLLKWANEERIHIETEEVSKFFGNKMESTITILDYLKQREKFPLSFGKMSKRILKSKGEIPYEAGAWVMLLDAADETGVVTHDDVKDWAKDHAKEVEEFAEKLEDYSKDALEAKGLISIEKKKIMGFETEIIQPSEEMEELTTRIVQFNRYIGKLNLRNQESVNQPMEWEDLLIWATLFNKSDLLVKQLEQFFPKEWANWTNHYPHYYGGYYGYQGFATSYTQGLSAGGFSPSGGAGGSVSSGGGGGAGGGGGGGAR